MQRVKYINLLSLTDSMAETTETLAIQKEKERLAKLWDAYELQEQELEQAKDKIIRLEKEISEKNAIIDDLKKSLRDRDERIRNLEVEMTLIERTKGDLEPRYRELNRKYEEERARLSKLYEVAEDLEGEIEILRKEITERDNWFKSLEDSFRKIAESIDERREMIDRLTFEHIEEEKIEEKVDTKSIVVEEFMRLRGLGKAKAEALFDAGYTSIKKLKEAKITDLASVKGISLSLARSIFLQVKKL